jgi:hypothetical protein
VRPAKADLAAQLAAKAAALQKPKGPTCQTCKLPPDWLEAVHGARDQHGTTFPALSAVLKAEGHNVGDSSLQHHFQHHR